MYLYGNSEKYLTDKNLNIGVRNYVLDSAKSVSMTGTGRDNDSLIINSLSKPLKQFTSEELSHVILSFNWAVSDGASGSVEIQFNDTPWDLDGQILKIDFSNAKSGRFCKKFNLATKKYYGGSINATGLAIKQSGFTGTFTADHIKLEIGDVPSQWCPAPEDLAKKKDIANPNLITGSKDFTGSKWTLKSENLQKDKYLDFTAVCINWAWGGIAQYIAVNKGETFTASMYVKAPAGSTISWYITLPNNETNYKRVDTNPSGITTTATGNWQRTSITFTVTGDSGVIKPRIESADSAPYWIAGMKLERGTNATPWCPAYEDYAMKSDLDALKAEIDQLKQNK